MARILGTIASSFEDVGDFESIATTTVGSGGAANVEFTSIPGTYTHLIIRGIARTDRTGSNGDYILIQMNGATSTVYSTHTVYGTGSTVAAGGAGTQSAIEGNRVPTTSHESGLFGNTNIQILDYANTNKLKVIRATGGYYNNGAGSEIGYTSLISGSYQSTNAITSILLKPNVGSNFVEYTRFSLYGIKVE